MPVDVGTTGQASVSMVQHWSPRIQRMHAHPQPSHRELLKRFLTFTFLLKVENVLWVQSFALVRACIIYCPLAVLLVLRSGIATVVRIGIATAHLDFLP